MSASLLMHLPCLVKSRLLARMITGRMVRPKGSGLDRGLPDRSIVLSNIDAAVERGGIFADNRHARAFVAGRTTLRQSARKHLK
jgi:hypothetical protein